MTNRKIFNQAIEAGLASENAGELDIAKIKQQAKIQEVLLSWQHFEETGESFDWDKQIKPWVESWFSEAEQPEPTTKTGQAWQQETENRIQAYEQGNLVAKSIEEVLEKFKIKRTKCFD